MQPRRINTKKLLAEQQQYIALLEQQNNMLSAALVDANAREEDYLKTIAARDRQYAQLQQEHILELQKSARLSDLNQRQEDIIHELNSTVSAQRRQLDKNKDLQIKLDEKKHELRTLKRYLMGIKSEQHHRPTEDENGQPLKHPQLSLDLQTQTWGTCSQNLNSFKKITYVTSRKTTTPKKPGGRKSIPDLPEEIIEIHPDNIPPRSKCVGYKDQVLIACDPLRWRKKIIRRYVYLTVAEDEITHKHLIAPLPPHPIPRCKMDITALVMMNIDKYLYHIPLWRQRRRFLQYGLELTYSTMVHDVGRIADILEPLAKLMLHEIIISGMMNVDETTYTVLDPSKKKGKKSHRGWMWATMNNMQRICCFIYQPGRGKKDIAQVLKGYHGHLMTDAYGAYTKYGKQKGVKHGKCLVHIRRYFEQSLENDHARASYALEQFFGPLYGIEEECKLLELNYDEITEMRQKHAVPVLLSLRQWLLEELPKLTPRTPIYKAVTYALNHFDGLMIYTEDGCLPVDNNALEREIRAITLGRHNHLFAGSHRGGERAAVMYSLIATCRLQNIDPSEWMSDVLRRISRQPADKLYELLPQFWKPLPTAVNKKAQTA